MGALKLEVQNQHVPQTTKALKLVGKLCLGLVGLYLGVVMVAGLAGAFHGTFIANPPVISSTK